jgi:hypothetical protein
VEVAVLPAKVLLRRITGPLAAVEIRAVAAVAALLE